MQLCISAYGCIEDGGAGYVGVEPHIFYSGSSTLGEVSAYGCWAYVEAVADAYCLVRGHKIPYLKNAANWKTSIDGITKLAEIDMTSGDSDEEGLDYNDYLMILMGLNMKTAYYRMLDVIQLNASQESPDFRMKNAAVAFGVDAEIGYREKTFDLHAEDGY